MDAQAMRVNPNDLVIDLPLDEGNVLTKMQSMSKPDGMVQPITVWLRDMRIIDGFHRTEAARRLGWDEVDVWVRDCDEEAFWDARIQSARQHFSIESERLAAWMVECWKQTKWHVVVSPGEDGYMPRRQGGAAIDFAMVERVWGIFGKKFSSEYAPKFDALTQEEREIWDWVKLRSLQWGVNIDQLQGMFLRAAGLNNFFANTRSYIDYTNTYDRWAKNYNLDLRQRLRLQREILREPGKHTAPPERIAKAYIQECVVPNIEMDYESFSSRRLAEEFDASLAERREAAEREKARLSDPSYLKLVKKRQRMEATKYCANQISSITTTLGGVRECIRDADDGEQMLLGLLVYLGEMCKELWPEKIFDDGLTSDKREAFALRREVEKLTLENDSLRRALGSKARVSANSVAVSGSELSRMAS